MISYYANTNLVVVLYKFLRNYFIKLHSVDPFHNQFRIGLRFRLDC